MLPCHLVLCPWHAGGGLAVLPVVEATAATFEGVVAACLSSCSEFVTFRRRFHSKMCEVSMCPDFSSVPGCPVSRPHSQTAHKCCLRVLGSLPLPL